jgi:hypothetical protein
MSFIATRCKSAASPATLANRLGRTESHHECESAAQTSQHPPNAAAERLFRIAGVETISSTTHGATTSARIRRMPAGTKDEPWELSTAPRTSTYTMWADENAEPPTLFCQVGSTQLRYQLRCLDDLHAWLVEQGDWVDLGAADEQKPAKEGTVEAWGRSADNPVGGWYGLRKGYRGRFGMYVPPLLEALGKVELTHDPRNNKVRAMT